MPPLSTPGLQSTDKRRPLGESVPADLSGVSYYQDLHRYCRSLVNDADTASDVVQETFQRFLALQHGGQKVLRPKMLLLRIARHLLIDLRRRSRLRDHISIDTLEETDLPMSSAANPEESLAAMQVVRAYINTIEALPPRCREAFVLHIFDELPYAQIADIMGISYSMVEKHIARAIIACKLCRQRLAAEHG